MPVRACYHTVTRYSLGSATTAPPIEITGFDSAGEHHTIRLEPLADDLQTEFVEAAEHGQVRAGEGSVRHVEVFRLGSVRTPIMGRPRPSSGDRRADHYTLNCEEPDNLAQEPILGRSGGDKR